MVTDAVTEMHLHDAAVYTGTAGAVATTGVGYVLGDDVVTIANAVPGYAPIRVQGKRLPLRHVQPDRQITVTVPLAQINADTMALALGVTKSGDTVRLGDSSDTILCPQMSLAVVGQDLNGDTIRADIPYCSVTPAVALSLTQNLPPARLDVVTFEAEAGTSDATQPYWTFGDITVTISVGGVLTVTTSAHKVAGQGAAADVLDSITWAGVSDGQALRLRPSTIAYAITLTHLLDTLELIGLANIDLGVVTLDEWIDLEYAVADTAWHMTGSSFPTS